jgi:two-component system phosphate regulon response regulator PhoB
MSGVQGEGAAVTERAIDVHMVSLRRKLGVYGGVIETVRGVGYRFKDSEE